MTRRRTVASVVALAVGILGLVSATAAEPARAGLIPPLTPAKPQPKPAPPPPPPPPPPTLRHGDNNADVRGVEQRLKDLAYDPGAIDGAFDVRTQFALVAFQKVHGLATTTEVDPPTRRALANPRPPRALQAKLGRDRVEVDIGMQLLTIYRGGRPALISHISSGNEKRYCVNGRCEVAHTPRGNFAIGRMVKGWEKSPLGYLYNSAYFRGGYALHGSKSVPMHPASHGCVRVPMHTAEWFQRLLYRGLPVHVGA